MGDSSLPVKIALAPMSIQTSKTATLLALLALTLGSSAQYFGISCGTVLGAGISLADFEAILTAHGTVRREGAAGLEARGSDVAQRPPANMRPGRWDNALAASAQYWANQCRFGHGGVGVGDGPRSAAGQNIFMRSAWSGDGDADWRNVLRQWDNAVLQDLDQDKPSLTSDRNCTQRSRQRDALGGLRVPQVPPTCNYGPARNAFGGVVRAQQSTARFVWGG